MESKGNHMGIIKGKMYDINEVIDLKIIEAGQNVVNFCPETSVTTFIHRFMIALAIKALESAPSEKEAERLCKDALREAKRLWKDADTVKAQK